VLFRNVSYSCLTLHRKRVSVFRCVLQQPLLEWRHMSRHRQQLLMPMSPVLLGSQLPTVHERLWRPALPEWRSLPDHGRRLHLHLLLWRGLLGSQLRHLQRLCQKPLLKRRYLLHHWQHLQLRVSTILLGKHLPSLRQQLSEQSVSEWGHVYTHGHR
jgi:hypothetical protein